jgi:hypothetical protein
MLVVKRGLVVLAMRHGRQPRLSESYRKRMNSAPTPHLHPLLDRGGEEKIRPSTFFTRGNLRATSRFPKGRGLR